MLKQNEQQKERVPEAAVELNAKHFDKKLSKPMNQNTFLNEDIMLKKSRREMIGGFIIQQKRNSSFCKNKFVLTTALLVILIYIYFNISFEKRWEGEKSNAII